MIKQQLQQRNYSNSSNTTTSTTVTSYNITNNNIDNNNNNVIHVITGNDDCPLSIKEYIHRNLPKWNNANNTTTKELIDLGSIWYLNAKTRESIPDTKPQRIFSSELGEIILNDQDYLRVHTNPRRFYDVHKYHWTKSFYNNTDNTSKRGIVIDDQSKEKGYWIIYKPPNISVHPTVDNYSENVAEQIRKQLILDNNNNKEKPYVATVQRLDQNTSGLFVVARSKLFAAYFSKLLRSKTELLLLDDNRRNMLSDKNNNNSIKKGYKCLVCLVVSTNNSSMAEQYQTLKSYENNNKDNNNDNNTTNKILTHYLKPSLRAPKEYVRTIPNTTDDIITDTTTYTKNYLESRLRITSVGDVVYPMYGSDAANALRKQLFTFEESENILGVVEITVELLTGRTHQIRGQLSAEGFPIVGDIPYYNLYNNNNNADIEKEDSSSSSSTNNDDIVTDESDQSKNNTTKVTTNTTSSVLPSSQLLALQCYYLKFLDPDISTNKHNETIYCIPGEKKENNYNEYQLNDTDTWWYSHLQNYSITTTSQEETTIATTNIQDLQKATEMIPTATTNKRTTTTLKEEDTTNSSSSVLYRPELLPPRVSLSPGIDKYIVVKAIAMIPNSNEEDKETEITNNNQKKTLWFVKSASIEECGGPYHAHVARDLVDWLKALDFISDFRVMGGGRIDYNTTKSSAHVYGFSYGFGRGNHAKVASIIEEYSPKIIATSDNSPGLY